MDDMISMYVDVDHKNWDDVLPYVTFAYNTAVQEPTGFTPFRLVHGQEAVTTLDSMLLHTHCSNVVTDAAKFTRCAEDARQPARMRIRCQQHNDADQYNLCHRDVTYQPGDKVWVRTPICQRGRSEKLLRRYIGPYRIVQRLGDVRYKVIPEGEGTTRHPRRPRLSDVNHVSRLKLYYSR